MRQQTAHLWEAPRFEPAMPTNIWSTPQHVEGEPEIGRGELGLGLEPRQRQTQNPIVGNGEHEARTLRRGFPRQVLPQQGRDMEHFIAQPRGSLAETLGDIIQPPDTPHGLQPDGFSVQRPRHRRDSPKALSAPVDVAGRVLLSIEDESTVGADGRAYGERLREALATAAPVLRRAGWMDRFHSLAGPGCRAREDRQEVAPSGVVQACVATGFAAGPLVLLGAVLILLRRGTTAQVGRRDRLVRDRVVLADQRQGGLGVILG